MANGYLDFSALNVKPAKTGAAWGEAIKGVGQIGAALIKEQTAKKERLYSKLEKTAASPLEINNATIKDAAMRYAQATQEENLKLIAQAGMVLDPKEQMEIDHNITEMGTFIGGLNQFSKEYAQYIAALNTDEGRTYYEPKEGAYKEFEDSLRPDPETGALDVSKVNNAIFNFKNTETGLPGLNLKKQDIFTYLDNKTQEWIDTHKGEKSISGYPVAQTPAGRIMYTEETAPVNWDGYEDFLKASVLADRKNYGMLKILSEDILNDERKEIAVIRYGQKDDMGNFTGNEQIAYLDYYINSMMDMEDIKKDIVTRKGGVKLKDPTETKKKDSRSRFWFGSGKKEEFAIEPRPFVADEYEIEDLYSISGRLTKEVVDVVRNAKEISGNETEEIGDIATTGTGYRVVGYDDKKDEILIVSEITMNGIKTPQYILAPRKDNEEMLKKLVDPATYGEIEQRHETKDGAAKATGDRVTKWESIKRN